MASSKAATKEESVRKKKAEIWDIAELDSEGFGW